ncbi:hypothetical protein [Methanosphaerula palustris]|uniref:Uncharacterized protein n=1 Tax=Methanosphaerula palustris (strain ATCC BAA-1556 / DSM 19958 / E1-9c) TaxID=521011 RepID=B8GEC4_METPE|nr:hypothetical protein [Methanosphaerula palustris]ACL17625.1 hypothetical protein Mpal_2342 [Methanosphaerula palustris E1-9c]
MKVTILVDNTALFDRFFIAEHGFSVFVPSSREKVLWKRRSPSCHKRGMGDSN